MPVEVWGKFTIGGCRNGIYLALTSTPNATSAWLELGRLISSGKRVVRDGANQLAVPFILDEFTVMWNHLLIRRMPIVHARSINLGFDDCNGKIGHGESLSACILLSPRPFLNFVDIESPEMMEQFSLNPQSRCNQNIQLPVL
jgi:hypothetical protein